MNKLIASIAAVAIFAPGLVVAAELNGINAGQPTVVLESWDAGSRTLMLRSGLVEPFTMFKCKVADSVSIPATANKGRTMSVTYTGPGLGLSTPAPALEGNTCSQVSLN